MHYPELSFSYATQNAISRYCCAELIKLKRNDVLLLQTARRIAEIRRELNPLQLMRSHYKRRLCFRMLTFSRLHWEPRSAYSTMEVELSAYRPRDRRILIYLLLKSYQRGRPYYNRLSLDVRTKRLSSVAAGC